MLHYGASSQLHFGYNTDNLANIGLETPDYSDVTTGAFDQEMKDVVTALYLYNQAANVFLEEN